jgi:hypothetical protein
MDWQKWDMRGVCVSPRGRVFLVSSFTVMAVCRGCKWWGASRASLMREPHESFPHDATEQVLAALDDTLGLKSCPRCGETSDA